MKILMPAALGLLLVFCSCNNSQPAPAPAASESDLDAARNFIRAALDGKWSQARQFMINDSTNTVLMDMAENKYNQMSGEDQRSYREASIHLFDSRKLGDTATIIHYDNSFQNKKSGLKVVNRNGQWLVDLKYTFFANDTARH